MKRAFPWRAGMRWIAQIEDERWPNTPEVSGRIEDGHVAAPTTFNMQIGPDCYADLRLTKVRPDWTDGGTIGALTKAAREEFGDPDLHVRVRFADEIREVVRAPRVVESPGDWIVVARASDEHTALLNALLLSPMALSQVSS